MKDCSTCPSFVPAKMVRDLFGKQTDTDLCARHGHILSRPSETDEGNERVRIAFATKCPDHGSPKPEFLPNQITAAVSIGDPYLQTERGKYTVLENDKPASCTGCKFFVTAPVVRKELSWSLPMCAIKGRLLFPTDLSKEALDCPEGERGSNRETTDGVILLPEYMPSVTVHERTGIRVPANLSPAIDPRELETSPGKPLTAAHKANHIIAWREILDPEGLHDPQYWPVFDWKAMFGEDPRASYVNHQPHLYLDHAGLLYDSICEMWFYERVPAFIGGAGSGKTELACHLAWLADLWFDLISLRGDTETYEFIGEQQLVEADAGVVTKFLEGIFTEAIQRPGVMCLDEINLAPEAVFHYLRPILLGATRLHIAQGNRFIDKHDYRFLVAAMNPSHDERNIGTKPLSAPDYERLVKIAVDLPPPNIEREIIKTHCRNAKYDLPEHTLDKIMQIADDLRRMSKDTTIPVAWGVRPQIMVALRTQTYSLKKAYRRVATDGFEESVADLVLASVESIV